MNLLQEINQMVLESQTVYIETRGYEAANGGKKPRGRGLWIFGKERNSIGGFEFNGSYQDAKKAAIAWGKENNIAMVHVLP